MPTTTFHPDAFAGTMVEAAGAVLPISVDSGRVNPAPDSAAP